MAASDFTTRMLVEAHAKRRRSITEVLIRALLGIWGGFTEHTDRELVLAQSARSVPLVELAQLEQRRAARSFATAVLREERARPERPLPLIENTYQRANVTALEVYQRPSNDVAYGLTLEEDPLVAQYRAERRIRQLAQMDMMLAERDELQKVYKASSKVTLQRRVIHPELARSGQSCGLCVVASDRVYNVVELMPIHDGCNCTSMPIVAGNDPGFRLNRADLDRLYDAAGSTFADDLRRVRVGFDEHGELGPIVRFDGQHWRDLDEVNADSTRGKRAPYAYTTMDDQRADWRKMLAASERAIARLRDDSTKGYPQALAYHQGLAARMRDNLR